ncbi:MAG: FAD-dependent oxidoreductase [Hornefia sp.]|nr:FAD-dependent oxidoreductase [Hornefia sp.]
MKILIVGGVAGGATAAARIRRLSESAEIIVFEKSGYVSYANCGLPYYIGDVITDKKELTLQTPEGFKNRFNVDVRVNSEVVSIDKEYKTVEVKNLRTGQTYTETYDKLILSPGARPAVPKLSGVDIDRVFTLRTVEDTFKIKEFVDREKPRTAVLAGGGFISLEMAENLIEMGVEVTIVQRPKQVFPLLDEDMVSMVHGLLKKHGAKLRLQSTVTGFEKDGESLNTLIENDAPVKSDMVILAIGVTPDSKLAKDAGLELGLKGSIAVNDRMETSEKDIYAVGDAIQVKHFVTGEDAVISLAGPANKQGRIAADNVCGGDSRYLGSQGSSVIKLFDMTVATTGINEKTAKAMNLDYDYVVLSPNSHAGYYPGAKAMTMKVIYEKSTLKILGAQIIGSEGVDKRIDVLATAIHAGVNAVQLKDLDLAYAPPYSSAKDPVNIAGFMIENISTGKVKQFRYDEVQKLCQRDDVTLLDTRTKKEVSGGSIEGFRNIPVDRLRDRLQELPKDKPVYVICQSGVRSYLACRMLTEHGFDAYNFTGGYRFYKAVNDERMSSEASYSCGMDRR